MVCFYTYSSLPGFKITQVFRICSDQQTTCSRHFDATIFQLFVVHLDDLWTILNIEPINYSYSRFVVSVGLKTRDMVSVDDQGPG
jgi:hypothetical protein